MLATIDPFWGVIAAALITAGGILAGKFIDGRKTRKAFESELSPNGGSSLRDAVDRIERGGEQRSAEFLQFRIDDAAWKGRTEQRLTAIEEESGDA